MAGRKELAAAVHPANGGVDLVSAPESVGAQSAQALQDFLVDRPGKLVPRGPLVGAALGGSVDAVGAVWNPTTILLSKKTSTVGRRLFPWETHLGLPGRLAANETDLVRADVNLRSVDLASFTAADQALVDIGLVPGPRSASLGGITYAISLDSAGELAGGDTVTLNDGTSKARKTEILSFNLSGAALPTFPNPSFDTNTTGWTPGTTTVTRDTGTFDSSPASGKLAGAGTVTTTMAGTFKQGVTYTLAFKAAKQSGGVSTIAASLGALGSLAPSNLLVSVFNQYQMTFTPAADTINPVLTLTVAGAIAVWVDTFTLTQTTANKFGANAPMCAQDIKAYLARLFVLGGAAPGSAPATLTVKNRTLWWTDPGGPVTRVLAEWQDDVSGLVNQIPVGDDDPTDPGVGLGILPNQILVFGRRSLWAVLGSSPSNFTVRRVDTVGCLDPRSIIEYQGAVYWLSEQGYMRYDGATLTNMSRAVQPTLLAAADQSVGVGGVAGGTALSNVLPNGYLHLTIGRRDTNSQLFDALLHVPTGAWTLLTSAAISGMLRAAFGAAGSGYFVDSSTMWLANGATHPERNPLADKGVTLADATKDSIVTVAGGVITVASSNKITPLWRTELLPLAGPINSSQLLRYLQDYAWIDPAQTADDASTGWQVKLKDGLGNTKATLNLGTQGTSSTKTRRRYENTDFSEVSSDLYLEFTVPGAAPAWTLAELYTGTILFAPSGLRVTE